MIETWPTNMNLWDQYAEVRRESIRSGDRGQRANQFLLENWDAMHQGAKVSWPDRKKKGELSGLQSAMNLYLDNPRGFRAEYQCEPEVAGGLTGIKELMPAAVASRLSGLPRYEVPREATRLVSFIDVGGEIHWYATMALDQCGGGAVIDYGTWPRQNPGIFARDDPRPGLKDLYPTYSEEQRVYAGLTPLVNEIVGSEYRRERTGEILRVERCLIDCGKWTGTIFKFVRASPFSVVVYPSMGRARSAAGGSVAELKTRPGERSEYQWRLTMSETERGRMVQYDTDSWKDRLFELLTTPPGGQWHLSFFSYELSRRTGEPPRTADHEMISQHCGAEDAEPDGYWRYSIPQQ